MCAIRDGHSRRVLGHVIADHIGADMVCDAIDRVVAARGEGVEGTVLHSDRGGEFTSGLTAKACHRHRPGVRRRGPSGSPTSSGEIRARRDFRKEPSSARRALRIAWTSTTSVIL
jgi:transposase InsO family protein